MSSPTGYTYAEAEQMVEEAPANTYEFYRGSDGLWYNRKPLPTPPPTERKPTVPTKDPVEQMRQRLDRYGYVTSDSVLLQQVALLEHDVHNHSNYVAAMLLDGPPGTGKTFLAETFLKMWDAQEFLSLQAFKGMSKDHLLYDLNIPAIVHAQAVGGGGFTQRDALEQGILWKALEHSLEHRVVLLLDEMDKAQEFVDSFLLEFLNSCAISDPSNRGHRILGNRKNLVVFLTKNNERPLSEPLMRRCRRVYMHWPEPHTECKLVRRLVTKELRGTTIKGDVDGLIRSAVQAANTFRQYEAKVRKVPSTPEVARAVADMLRFPPQHRGQLLHSWLFAYDSDAKDLHREVGNLRPDYLQKVLEKL